MRKTCERMDRLRAWGRGMCAAVAAAALAAWMLAMPALGAESDAICINEDIIKACDIEGHINVETDFGDFVADALCWYASADLALVPSGEFANNLQPGNVTRESLANVLERNSEVAVTELTPRQIYSYLEVWGSYIPMNEDDTIDWDNAYAEGYLQVSGIRVKLDTAAPVGEKIMALTLADGTALDRDDDQTVYRVVSTEELLTGGYGYPAAAEYETLGCEIDLVAAYMTHLGTIGIPEDGKRVKVLGTREFFSGYGRMVGALVVLFGLIITFTIKHLKRRLKEKESEYREDTDLYEIDK